MAVAGLVLRSPAFNDHDRMPDRFSLQAGNTSPALQWSGVPEGTAELVLMCEDPDAPSGAFLHWLVTGIDPDSDGVAEGEVPRGGREWRNDFGEIGWGGPHPPVGDQPHRYFFHLYALREPLDLPNQGSRAPRVSDVQRAARERQLASATLVGIFAR